MSECNVEFFPSASLIITYVGTIVILWTYRRYCIKRKVRLLPPVLRNQEKEKHELEIRKEEKLKEERKDKRAAAVTADDLLDIYSEIGEQYSRDTLLPEMGSRLYKYWYRVTSQDTYGCHILTIGSISKDFTCSRDVERYINSSLSQLHHPYLQTINQLKFVSRHEKEQVVIIQIYWEKGSLKDLIYKTTPTKDWAHKYNKTSESLSPNQISIYGEQILEGVVYLYGRGFRPLGHIQTGNIYIEGDETCRLGGFENTILKYKPRLHKTCVVQQCLEDIDVIMFGHVIYEMSAGKECPHLVPSEEDYEYVKNERCKDIIQYIFKRKNNGRFVRNIQEVVNIVM